VKGGGVEGGGGVGGGEGCFTREDFFTVFLYIPLQPKNKIKDILITPAALFHRFIWKIPTAFFILLATSFAGLQGGRDIGATYTQFHTHSRYTVMRGKLYCREENCEVMV
jgi:hypothetical protein